MAATSRSSSADSPGAADAIARALRVGRAVTRASLVQEAETTRLLRPLALTRAQMAVLSHLPREGRTMGELARMVWCDASNLTGVVGRLVAAGLVERGRLEGDRRTIVVVPTRSGIRKQKEIAEVIPPYHLRATEGLTKSEQEQLLSLLEKYMRGAAISDSQEQTIGGAP